MTLKVKFSNKGGQKKKKKNFPTDRLRKRAQRKKEPHE